MSNDTTVLVSVCPPSPEDNARVALSMMHSAYLTVFHHIGDDYVRCSNTDFICELLLSSLSDRLPPDTQAAAVRFARAVNRFITAYPPSHYTRVLRKALQLSKHPVLLFRMEGHSFFGAVLPYQRRFVSLFPVPGFGAVGADGLRNFIDLGNSTERIPFEKFKIGMVAQADGGLADIRAFWETHAV